MIKRSFVEFPPAIEIAVAVDRQMRILSDVNDMLISVCLLDVVI